MNVIVTFFQYVCNTESCELIIDIIMKTGKLSAGIAFLLLAVSMQSCGGQSRPENNNGHNLWLGDITVKSGPADVAVWKIESKRIDLNALGVNDIGFDASGIYNNSFRFTPL